MTRLFAAGRGRTIHACAILFVLGLLLPGSPTARAETITEARFALSDPAFLQSQPTDDAIDGDATDGDEADGAADAEEGETEARDYGRIQPIVDLVEAGGPIIVILGLLSLISFAIIIAKLVQFGRLGVWRRSFVSDAIALLCAGRGDEALDKVAATKGVIAQVMEAALKGRTLGPEAEDIAREEVTRVAQAKLDGMESGLNLLRMIATISPLLGLLGTVLGMIEAFQQLQSAGDRVDPAILSGGIWEALLTTAAGLTVAIPAAAVYSVLQRTVEATAQGMEDAATQCFTAPLYARPPAHSETPPAAPAA